MKKTLLFVVAFACLCLPAFAQTGAISRTVPLALPYGPLRSPIGANNVSQYQWCTPDLSTYPYPVSQFLYEFPSGAPSAVTLTVTGSTDGRTFSTVDTGTTTTGGTIAVPSIYNILCMNVTTLTGSGVTVAGTYVGIPTIGAVSVDPTGIATAANQTNGNQKGQVCDAGGDCATVTGSKLDVNATISTAGLATSAIQTDGTQKAQICDSGGDCVTVTGSKLDVNATVDTTGLATATNQTGGGQKSQIVDGSGNVIGSTGNKLDVDLKSGAVASGAFASGALASGAVASGAIASGAVASGAYASGSIGSGAIASGAIASGAVASGAIASGAAVAGAFADGAIATIGVKADAKNAATDSTAITLMQVEKQISEYLKLISTGTATASVTDPCDGTIPSIKRYISAGSSEDESEVKATPGTLCSIQARNAHASADAFLKCTNLTAANTTPGSSAVYYDMIVPHGGGYVNAVIHAPFSVALTCYIVTGKADNDATEVAASDVSYFLLYQ